MPIQLVGTLDRLTNAEQVNLIVVVEFEIKRIATARDGAVIVKGA